MGRYGNLWFEQTGLETVLALPNGIPVQIPFDECLNALTPKYLSVAFRDGYIVETLGAQVIPIDGKTLKGSYDREQGKSALHL